MSALPSPSTLSTDRSAPRAVGISMRGSTGGRLVSLIAAWVVVLGLAVIGLAHATQRIDDAGISLAAAGASGPSSAVVRNASGLPLTGELVVTSGKASSSIPLRLQPGETRSVAIEAALSASCRIAVDVRLEVPGAPPEAIQLPCAGRPTS